MTEAERLAQALESWDGKMMMPPGWRDRVSRVLRSQAAELEALRAALIWYRDEAAALHKYVGSGAHTNAVLASVAVLALDAGARADAAIDAARKG